MDIARGLRLIIGRELQTYLEFVLEFIQFSDSKNKFRLLIHEHNEKNLNLNTYRGIPNPLNGTKKKPKTRIRNSIVAGGCSFSLGNRKEKDDRHF